MSSLSQFTGGGGTPVGASITALDAPVNFTAGAQEYLRVGSLKAYDSSYAAAVAVAPQLRVFGTNYGDTSTGGTAGSCYYCGTNYVRVSASGVQAYYGSTLALCSAGGSAPTGVTFAPLTSVTQVQQTVGTGNGYLVFRGGTNLAPVASGTGTAFSIVGGSFGTYVNPTTIAYLGAYGWLALSTIDGTAGSRAYIANTNPTGSWTVDAPASASMTEAYSAATNGSIIVVTGLSSSATAGKIVTSATLAGAYTDRTSTCGITFLAADSVHNCVYTGSKFLAIRTSGAITSVISSTDGLTWSSVAVPVDAVTASPVGATGASYTHHVLRTNGAGTVVMQLAHSTNTYARALIMISTDHGVTWAPAQASKVNGVAMSNVSYAVSMTYANGKYIASWSGEGTTPTTNMNAVDLGDLTQAPTYIGQQVAYAQGQFVRIK